MARKVSIEYGSDDLAGSAEAAAILKVPVSSISRWDKAGKMPVAVAELKATKVWLRIDIKTKAENEGR